MKANRNLKQNDEAVSPVIGVILMVAITVILAAVIGAFVFGMGPPEAAPQASLRASAYVGNPAEFVIEHQGGDEIALNLTDSKLLVGGVAETGSIKSLAGITGTTPDDYKFTVGEQMTITPTVTTVIASGTKITIIDVVSQKPIATFTVRL